MHAVIRIKEQKERAESGPVMCFQTDNQTDTRTQAHWGQDQRLNTTKQTKGVQSTLIKLNLCQNVVKIVLS